jgi:hypothetical protein
MRLAEGNPTYSRKPIETNEPSGSIFPGENRGRWILGLVVSALAGTNEDRSDPQSTHAFRDRKSKFNGKTHCSEDSLLHAE